MLLGHGRGMLVIAISLLLAGMAAAQSADLSPKFKIGDTAYLEVSQDVTQKVTGGRFGPEGRTLDWTNLRTVRQVVQSISEKTGTSFALTFDRVKRTTAGPVPPPQAYDSDAPAAASSDPPNVLATMLGPIVGMTIEMTFDSRGYVTKLRGMDKVLDKVEDAAAGSSVFEQSRDEYSDDAARILWGDARMALYAFRVAKVGDTWGRTFSLYSLTAGDLTQSIECRFDRIEEKDGRKFAVINYTSRIRRSPDAATPPSVMGRVLTYERGDGEGSAWFDIEQGLIVRETEKSTVLVAGKEPGPEPGTTADLRFERTTHQTVTRLTEAERAAQRKAAATVPVTVAPSAENPE